MSNFVIQRAERLGLKIEDAKTPITVEVSRGDISKATPLTSKQCAFSRACRRMPKVRAAYFFRSTAWIEYADKIVRYSLPPSVQKEIVSFDRARVTAMVRNLGEQS